MTPKSPTLPEPQGIHVRPAQLGDICLLLEPKRDDEILNLKQWQTDLLSRFGGEPIERVHLTCQRFACLDDNRIQAFTTSLEQTVSTVDPFPLTAISLQTLLVAFRKTHILKWQVQVTDEVQQFATTVESLLGVVGIEPLYISGFTSSLVAALKDVSELAADRLSSYGSFPHHLFTAEQAVLSKIMGANEFEILASVEIGTRSLTCL